tara:strand:- start:97 stop:471 length:375 start_codon:yes stop_codon:yes gene_type:complete
MSGEDFTALERLKNLQEVGERLDQNAKIQAELTAQLQRSMALQALWAEHTDCPDLYASVGGSGALVNWIRTPLSQPNPRFILKVTATIWETEVVTRTFEPEQYEPYMSVPADIVEMDRRERNLR